MENYSIITDLAVLIICAAVVSVTFKALRLPVLLGYLLSGVLVGPNFLETSPIKNIESVKDLSELGVIFLMFYIGLEFDLAKLKRVLTPAFLAVTLQTLVMVLIGVFVAPWLGWGSINGLFLGFVLAISSTMITIPILRDQGTLNSNFAQFSIGILIFEDILAILSLVILTGVADTGSFSWSSTLSTSFFVGVFIIMVFVVGKLLSPLLLRLLKRHGSPEMILLTTVAVVLGVGELAHLFHFSLALGAFLAGSILSQNELAHEIEKNIEPLRNLFTAVFFVSVGMLIQPEEMLTYWPIILLLTILVVVGKSLTTFLGIFLGGEKPETGLKAAFCKAQIGEFSFVIAALGQSKGVTDSSLMAIAVGVALGTIIIVPPLSNNANHICGFLARITPNALLQVGSFYTNVLTAAKTQLSRSAFLRLAQKPLIQILFYFFLFNGVVLTAHFSGVYLEGIEGLTHDAMQWWLYGIWGGAALLGLPFLIGVIRNLEVLLMLISESAFSNIRSKHFAWSRIRNTFNLVVLLFVVAVFSGIYLSSAAVYLPDGMGLILFVLLLVILGYFFWRHFIRVGNRLEYLFIKNFNNRVVTAIEKRREETFKTITERYPWKVEIKDFVLHQDSAVCGLKIKDLNLRSRSGATILGLSRDAYINYDVSPESTLFPDDHLLLVGDQDQLTKAKALLAATDPGNRRLSPEEGLEVYKILVSENSPLVNLSLAQSEIRRRFRLNVIGIQRAEKQITSPRPEEILQPSDLLVVVGCEDRINAFCQEVAGVTM